MMSSLIIKTKCFQFNERKINLIWKKIISAVEFKLHNIRH